MEPQILMAWRFPDMMVSSVRDLNSDVPNDPAVTDDWLASRLSKDGLNRLNTTLTSD